MLKNVMLESEMEQYCISIGVNIFVGEDNLLDTALVIGQAMKLGYEPYMLDGNGMLDETLVFIKE